MDFKNLISKDELHIKLRKKLIFNSIIMAIAIYFNKFDPISATITAMTAGLIYFFVNVYFVHKLNKLENKDDLTHLQLIILENYLNIEAFLIIAAICCLTGLFNTPALIKPYISF